MSDGKKAEAKVRRTMHFRFRIPGAPDQLLSMIKSSAPLYQLFADAKVTLLQNVDDPDRFIQVIDYEAHGEMEMSRQKIASDPRVQAYLQSWRTMFPGGIEVDVFKEI